MTEHRIELAQREEGYGIRATCSCGWRTTLTHLSIEDAQARADIHAEDVAILRGEK